MVNQTKDLTSRKEIKRRVKTIFLEMLANSDITDALAAQSITKLL